MINYWPSDQNNSQAQVPDLSDQDSQYAPTLGYDNNTPPSCYAFSPSPACHLQDDSQDGPQNGPVALSLQQQEIAKLLQFCEWEASRPDDDVPSNFIRYTIDWKVKVNNRFRWEDTIKDVVLTPSAYWSSALKDKLDSVIHDRVPRNRRVRSDGTSVVVSVDDRKHKNVKTWHKSLDIDWTAVEEQLLAWGNLYIRGKELRVAMIFSLIEDDHHARGTARRGEKRGKSSVTTRMLDERDAQLDAEEHASGQPSVWRVVYGLMRCPSPSCHLGPHCWQDPHGKKHYQLRTHHLKRLIAYVEGGGVLESQDDVPEAIRQDLYMEEQQRLEHSQPKSNKQLTLGSCPPINIHFMGGQPSLQPPLDSSITALAVSSQQSRQEVSIAIDGPRDVAVKEYSAWQETNVIDEGLKAQFQLACDVTLVNGLDLEQVHEDGNPTFFVEKGVAIGIARRFVGDIMKWAQDVRS
ncbi:hypothetical protein N7540_011016 [Penicillium herquei]|nr:hypothetical protein N7540_011016 [Penicillium herquei]